MKVGEETSLRCEGDGSPEPEYEWQQKLEDGDTSMVMVRLRETVLHIRSVSEGSEGWQQTGPFEVHKMPSRHSERQEIPLVVP